MFQIAELSRSKEALKEKALRALSDAGVGIKDAEGKSDKVKIVFAGQYSAGKSSIIKMLTGDDTIATGAKITTQETHTYEWNGLEIVDTPGVHTSLRPDHDEISYKAIAAADILVFVITNELFDSYMADHFRRLAIDKDKAGEMILVVNKMERAAKGNTEEQQNIIREDLRTVLAPYTPEQLHLSFLDAQSYLDSVEERAEDPELADELLARSGYDGFIKSLNMFVEEKALASKLTTDLYVLDNELDKAISDLTPGAEDSDIDELENNLQQQRRMLIDARTRIQREVQDIYYVAASRIREIGLDAASAIDSNLEKEDIEEKLSKYSKEAEGIQENARSNADVVVRERFDELGQDFVDMEATEINQKLKIRLVDKYDSLPDSIKRVFITATDIERNSDLLAGVILKSGLPEQLSINDSSLKKLNLSNNSQHFIRDSFYIMANNGGKIASSFTKSARAAATISRTTSIASLVGAGIDTLFLIKEGYEEQLQIDAMKNNRQNIRSAFNKSANELENFSKEYINHCIVTPMEKSIKSVENNISELRTTRTNRSEKCVKLEQIQKEIQILISRIHDLN